MYDFVSEEFETEIDPFDSGEFELEYDEEMDYFDEFEMDNPFSESEEMELAADLLGVTNEEELEQFIGKLFRRIKRKAGRSLRSPIARTLFRAAKPLIRRALPIAGGALGTAIGGPLGGMAGSGLASMAGRLFGLELEGLSPEDQEFEVARRVVRVIGAAAKKASAAPSSASPTAVAKAAVKAAAKRHAPGLVKKSALPSLTGSSGRSGRWIRRGRKIVLLGI